MNTTTEKITSAVSIDHVDAYLWLMFAICFLGNVMGGTASTLMSVYLPVAVKDFIGVTTNDQFNFVSAYISALYFVGWAFGGLTWGYLGDRLGRTKSLGLSICMFGFFTFMTSMANSWTFVLVSRFFCGFGVGGMMVLNSALLAEVWPARSRAIFIGILSIGFPVGIFSSGAVNYLISEWQQGFMIGIVPFCLGVAALLFLNESQAWIDSKNKQKDSPAPIPDGHSASLLSGIVVFGTMLIGLWAVFSWIPTWVQTLLVTGDGQKERGLTMMLMGIGGLSGGFVSGWIANAVGTRKAMLACFAGCFALSLLLFKGNDSFTTITLVEIAALAFTFGVSQGTLAAYIPLLFPVNIRSTATGVCFNVGRFFTAAAVFFVGALVDVFGGYGNSLFAFSFVFLVGTLVIMFSKRIII